MKYIGWSCRFSHVLSMLPAVGNSHQLHRPCL